MDRAEKIGLGVAVAGHGVLFGLLSLGFLAAKPDAVRLERRPVEVSLVKEIGLEATAPAVVEPPAQSIAPEQGAPEEAAAPAPAEPDPAPAPPPPAPQPAPKPQPRAVAKSEPAPRQVRTTKPAPAPKPVTQPKPALRPVPAPKAAAPAKAASRPAASAPARSTSAVAPSRNAVARAPAGAAPSTAKGSGTSAAATASRPRGSRLGNDFLKGLSSDPSPSKSVTPPAAKIDARALAGIQDAISRQIQPCADRQVDPGPGANQIVTVLNLRLNRDGTLAATPTVVRQSGVDGDNDRYARRVVDLGVAAFKGCSPLKLPAEFYSTPNGGWNNINYRWQLR